MTAHKTSKRHRRRGAFALRAAAAVIATSSLAACGGHGFLSASGPVAAAQRDHFYSIIMWMMIVILPVFIGLPLVLWRYRYSRPRGAYRPNWRNSVPLEVLAWGVPAIVVVVLGINLWNSTTSLDPYKPLPGDTEAPLNVDVIAMDWKFLFVYRDLGIATANELVIPVGRTVSFRLTSQSVMQSFMIPRLGGQIYAMAGMVTKLHLKADEAGSFTGRNTQYNGPGFADQSFETRAVAPDAFNAWVAKVRDSGETLDQKSLDELVKPSTLPSPITFATVPKDVFDSIVTQSRAPEAAPASKPEKSS